MPAFADFLFSCIPLNDHSALDPILTRYNQEFSDGAMPSVERPFILSPIDIGLLIAIARKHQSEKLFIALARMGTVEFNPDKTIKEPFDPFIGRRDKAIETAMIIKAIELKSREGRHDEMASRIVYGLSGNPPTLNHLRFIVYLLSYSEVTVVLNAQSPLKSLDSYVAPDIRLEMLQSMVNDLDDERHKPRLDLSRVEIDRPPPSRMVVTMSILTLLSKKNEPYTLVLGIDALPLFTRWYRWEELGKLCCIKFYRRSGETLSDVYVEYYLKWLEQGGVDNIHMVFNTESEYRAFLTAHPALKASVEIIPDMTEGSATAIRAWYREQGIASDRPFPPSELNVHPAVHAIVQRYGLFRSPVNTSIAPAVSFEANTSL